MYFQRHVQLFVHHGLLIKSWTNSTASLQSQHTIAFNAGWLWLGFAALLSCSRHQGYRSSQNDILVQKVYTAQRSSGHFIHCTSLNSVTIHSHYCWSVHLNGSGGKNWWHTFCTYFLEVMSELWRRVGTTGFLAVMNHMTWWQQCDFSSIWQKTGQISQSQTQFTVNPVKRIMMGIRHIQSMRGLLTHFKNLNST